MDRRCDACQKQLVEIAILDRGPAVHQQGIEYTSLESKRSFWSGRFPVEGNIVSLMCLECGRVYLFAKPGSE